MTVSTEISGVGYLHDRQND